MSNMTLANTDAPTLKMTKLADNVYQHVSYKMVGSYGMVGASGLVVVDGLDAHLIDTPWTVNDTKALVAWISSKNLILKGAVITHYHQDASGGLSVLNRLNIKTYATSLTNSLLSQKHLETSNAEISSDTFKLASNNLEIFYPGAGHTKDNIVVWLPKNKILFGGCFVKNINSKNLGYTGDASVVDWPQSIKNVVSKYPNIKVVVPGHGELGGINLLEHTKQLALDVLTSNHVVN